MATVQARVSVTVAGEPVTREVTLDGAVVYLEREGFVEETGEKHRRLGDRAFVLRGSDAADPAMVFVTPAWWTSSGGSGRWVADLIRSVAGLLGKEAWEVLEQMARLSVGAEAGEVVCQGGWVVDARASRCEDGERPSGRQEAVVGPARLAELLETSGAGRGIIEAAVRAVEERTIQDAVLRRARERVIWWSPGGFTVSDSGEPLPGQYESLVAARRALGVVHAMQSLARAKLSAVPVERQGEAGVRASRSFSVPETCVRRWGCRIEGGEVVWPNGERWPRRQTAAEILGPVSEQHRAIGQYIQEDAVPGLHGAERDVAVVIRHPGLGGMEVPWVGDGPPPALPWALSKDEWAALVAKYGYGKGAPWTAERLAGAAEQSSKRREGALKVGLATIGGEVKLVPQDGQVLRVQVAPGEHVWDGVDEKAHAGWLMSRGKR